MKITNAAAGMLDYRLNILGIRVWENSCQLIARSGHGWNPVGPRFNLPVEVPRTQEQLEKASTDTLLMTAYQYEVERPGTDLVQVLTGVKPFSEALTEETATSD